MNYDMNLYTKHFVNGLLNEYSMLEQFGPSFAPLQLTILSILNRFKGLNSHL